MTQEGLGGKPTVAGFKTDAVCLFHDPANPTDGTLPWGSIRNELISRNRMIMQRIRIKAQV